MQGKSKTIWSTSASQFPRTAITLPVFAKSLSIGITCLGSYSFGKSFRGPWYKRSPNKSILSGACISTAFTSCFVQYAEPCISDAIRIFIASLSFVFSYDNLFCLMIIRLVLELFTITRICLLRFMVVCFNSHPLTSSCNYLF